MQGFPPPQGKLARALRVVLCLACLYHMAAMLVVNLPSNTAFGTELRAPFDPYVTRAGLWQNWVMFHTIPYFRAIRPMLVARDAAGKTTDYGPMLPGLTPYVHRTRLASLFLRYTWPTDDMQPHVRAYLTKACGEIERSSHVRPHSVTLRLDSLRLMPFADVRKLKRVARPASDMSAASMPCN